MTNLSPTLGRGGFAAVALVALLAAPAQARESLDPGLSTAPLKVCADPEYSMASVCSPATPSAFSPCWAWKAVTAVCVPAPYWPSTSPL